ncbi:MAG: aminoglycoside phosphotransferase family protein [Microbacteriaceae bacterium]|nr:aminoglycoside phosphotransferase family protein [Microbacteriaceae bacterium]
MEQTVELTAAEVSRLVERQHPRFAAPVTLAARGWDSDTFRLGDRFAARLPRRAAGVPLVVNEQRWLVELAPTLPVAVPAAVAVGRASPEYPWAWSILPWFEGTTADRVDAAARDRCAAELADFLVALHRPAPPDAPRSHYRGIPLAGRDARVREHLALAGDEATAAQAVWADALRAPESTVATWAHGDLHPGNVVLGPAGNIAAVIDFGDFSAGDPAVDLAAAWLFFTPASRRLFRQRLDASGRYDAHTWRRARGWAVDFSLGLIAESDGSDRMTSLGRAGLAAIAADR